MAQTYRTVIHPLLIIRRASEVTFVLLVALLGSVRIIGQTEVPAQSDQVVNSIGINVHLNYIDTLYYTNFPLVQSSLVQLGIRHVRDGEPINPPPNFYSNHSALLANGIQGTFTVQITDQPADLANLPAMFAPGYFEGYEPPDECDVSGQCGSPWVNNLLAFLPTLQANSGSYPVLGPSFGNPLGPPQLGSVSAYTQAGNMHNYKSGWNPGFPGSYGYGYSNYLSDALGIYLAGIANPNQPVMSTETGYTNATTAQITQTGYPLGTWLPYDPTSVSESVAATYMPRIPLVSWLNGIQRTYIYELISSPNQDYGLLRGDGTTKSSYWALEALIKNLQDPGPSFPVQPLTYTITGGVPTMQHLLVQKRNGKYTLVIWLEASIYDKFHNTPTPVAPVNVQVATACPMLTAQSQAWSSNGSVAKTVLAPGTLNISVAPTITMVTFTVSPSGCASN